ncbi:MAG TPA: TraM recognition domain-containing protein [Urbifossiella sp.]|jgi:hypothetical protein|nr:TraM recognition domain-containing protein [Urbifossiella sp.]
MIADLTFRRIVQDFPLQETTAMRSTGLEPEQRLAAIPQPFDLDSPLIRLTDKDSITFRTMTAGTMIAGATGGGKTTGPGAAWATALLRQGAGLCVLCAKSDEADLWLRRANQAGRTADVRRFAVDQPFRLNLLDYAFRQPGATRGGGDPQNVVDLLMRLLEVKPERSSSSGDQVFFVSSARQLMTATVSLLGAAGEAISFAGIDAVLDSAPYSPDDFTDPKWQETSYLNTLLDRMADREKDLTSIQRNDARVSLEYFTRFARMDDRTRSGILATVQSIIWPFRYGPAAELCGSTTNLTPEDVFRGKIVILDLPIKQYHESGLLIQASWKLLFQRAAEARDLTVYPLPVGLWIDEAHNFLTSYDALFQATARSSLVASVLLFQNLDSIRSRFPSQTGAAEAQALISNLGTKILCANDHAATNKWAADTLGEVWLTRTNSSASLTGEGNLSAGTGTNESRRYKVEPSEFLRLRKGGPDRLVDTILFRSGLPFLATGTNHLRVAFEQS